MEVTLDPTGDNPQLIFESLNSTGLALSQSDLIRNYLLMRLPEAQQTYLYEQYWCKLEGLFRPAPARFDSFVRDFLAYETRASRQEKADRIYQAFRRHFTELVDSRGGLEPFLQRMLQLGRYYAAFAIGTDYLPQMSKDFENLRRLVDVPALLIMRLFDCFEHRGTLTIDEFSQAVRILESYVFRRAVCGEQSRGYWSVFTSIAHRIDEN